MIYLFLLVFIASVGLINCLFDEDNEQTLNYNMSLFYSSGVMFFMVCVLVSLIWSGGLRLISLLHNSEAAGLELLGPENVAIVRIRWISIITSLSFQAIMVFLLKAGLLQPLPTLLKSNQKLS